MTTDPATTPDHPRPDLPPPFDVAEVAASVSHGRRRITLTIPVPGSLYRCGFRRAWFELTEREPWSGRPSLIATRQPPGAGWANRTSFTTAANRRIVDDVLPPVIRYGWATWWSEVHRRREPDCDAVEQAEHALRVARWWLWVSSLQTSYAFGSLMLDPLPAPHGISRQRRVDLWGNVTREPVIAAAVVQGQTVGWLTDTGDLLAPGHLLDPPPTPAAD